MQKINIEKSIFERIKNSNKWIILPEAEDCDRVLNAGLSAVKKNLCNIILIGSDKLKKFENDKIKVINHLIFSDLAKLEKALFELRKEKGLSLREAKTLLKNKMYFSTMLLKLGYADGIVCGAITHSKDVLKPALQIIKAEKGITTVSACMIFTRLKGLKQNLILMADSALVLNPTSQQLADIAIASNETFEMLTGEKSKVAFLSYSTCGSGAGETVDKIKEAVGLLKSKRAKFTFDGELQGDAALDAKVAKRKCPKSKIQGDANVLIYPNLDAGNISYKIFQQVAKCRAVGPITQGLAMPVNDLSRAANEEEIVLTIAVTCLQSLKGKKK